MVVLESIAIINKRRIEYKYSCDGNSRKYFNKNDPFFVEYEEDISEVPQSILVIPFLANVLPIAWFANFKVSVNEVDHTFSSSLENLREEFRKHYPKISKTNQLISNKSVVNNIDGNNTALLFSGGLDAFESLVRNYDKNPYLVSVHGADIEIADTKRWEDFKKYNEKETVIAQDRMCYVKSNLRTFYTYEVDLLINIGWWGKIQHGIALLTLMAPLSYIHNITKTLIASSNTGEVNFGWGSTSETDEKVKWANQIVIHDGFEFRRTEKIENIVKFAKKTNYKVKLRVCYSELRDEYNCNRCAKCQRTILGFLLCGEDPNDYGFNVPENYYDLVLNNFKSNSTMSIGVKYEWKCLQEKAATINALFIIRDEVQEKAAFRSFLNLNIDNLVNTDLDKVSNLKHFKYILINKFSNSFKFYLKIRRKF